MVVLGSWPYAHTSTLDMMKRQMKISSYYFVDEDRIVTSVEATNLASSGYLLDDTYMTIMSEDMYLYLTPYREQIFPPPIPQEVQTRIKENSLPAFTKLNAKVQNSAPVLLVNGQDKEVMEDVGAVWNTHLGVWILDVIALKTLRERKKKLTPGKVYTEPYLDSQVKIYGDLTKHVSLLKNAGATYNEADDVWYLALSSLDRISSILN